MSSVRDIIFIAVLLFAVAICITFAVDIGHRVNSNLLTIGTINSSVDAVGVIDHADAAINMTDYLYLACFIAFFIGIIIFGYITGGNPILAPIYFFALVIFVFVSIILQLVWIDIANNPEVITATVSLPITMFIVSNLGYFMTAFGLIGIVIMFAKRPEVGSTY
jgi:hypothetical protein